eukprot:Hpha_TRINITY_DN9741_c0_g1::TRINITY_DN9741_c0_g1_i1::g.10279::m.10279
MSEEEEELSQVQGEEADDDIQELHNSQNPLSAEADVQKKKEPSAAANFTAAVNKCCGALSVHAKVALVTTPVMLCVLACGAVLLTDTAKTLDDFDDTPTDYISHVGDLVWRLAEERTESIVIIRTAHIGKSRDISQLERMWTSTDRAYNKLVDFRFHTDNMQSRFEEDNIVGRLNPLIQTAKRADLVKARQLVMQELLAYNEKDVQWLFDFYNNLINDLLILGGRRIGHRLRDFSSVQLGLFGTIELLVAWSQSFSTALWLRNGPSTMFPRVMTDVWDAGGQLEVADIMFRSFQHHSVLSEADRIAQTNAHRSLTDLLLRQQAINPPTFSTTEFDFSQAQIPPVNLTQVQERLLAMDTSTDVLDALGVQQNTDLTTMYGRTRYHCIDAMDQTFKAARSLEDVTEDDVEEREDRYVRRIVCLTLLIVGAIGAVAFQFINLWLYQKNESQVRNATREVQKLEEAVARMWEYCDDVEAFELDTLDLKVKGVPAAESILYSSLPRVKELGNFLPRAMLSQTMRNLDELHRPYTDLALQPSPSVTVLVLNLSELNMISPSEGDPVKQKALETQMNKFLSTVEQTVDPLGGMMVSVLADSCVIAWNLFGDAATPKKSAVDAAIAITQQKELHLLRAGAGIATGDVLLGNVGTETLASLVVLGPAIPFARHIQHLTEVYGLRVMIDSVTQEGDIEGDNCVRMVDFVLMEMGGTNEGLVPLFEVYPLDPDADEEQAILWKSIFKNITAGESAEAKAEYDRYMSMKTEGVTDLDHHVRELIDKYPDLPGYNVFDFVEASAGS